MSARDGEKDRFGLSGRVAVVTGGAGLLGAEFGRAMAEHGATIVLADVKGDRVETVAKDIAAQSGVQALGLMADVTDPQSVQRLVKAAIAAFGCVDILVNSAVTETAAARFYAPFEEYSLEDWEAVMAVNVRGVFLCCQAFGREMIRRKRGSVINMASIYGLVGPDPSLYAGTPLSLPGAYSASKGAVISLTRHLATYWAAHGIRVNCITPGGIQTDQVDRTFIQNYAARTPLGRMADKADLWGAVLFLASDASSYVTGHNLVVDGGWTAR